MSVKHKIDGVTFSGGEPFDQALGLTELAKKLVEKGLSIMSYSGYTIEEIQAVDKKKQELLKQLDILIDGPFILEKLELKDWKGSSNQRVHYLADLEKSTEKSVTEALEIIVDKRGAVEITGTFAKENILELLRG